MPWNQSIEQLPSCHKNHVTNFFHKAKEHRVQWQLNKSYCLTCTPGHVAAQSNQHGNRATVTVDIVILDKFQAAYVSKITVELTTFLPCSLKNKTECNGGVVLQPMSNAAGLYL